MTDQTPPRRRLVLHIGPTKTGTTTIQKILWNNQRALRRAGVFVPGSRLPDHFQIGMDIRGRRHINQHHLGRWKGTYRRALKRFATTDCHTMVISDEVLGLTDDRRAAAAVAAAADLDVHVIYCMRELSGLLVSQWQGRVRNGIAEPLDEWLERIREHEHGNSFWVAHDAPAVVDRWTRAGAAGVHVITLPPSTAPRDTLWRRFQEAAGWSAETDPAGRTANEALGLVEIDLMRRIQENYVDQKIYGRRPVINHLIFRETLTKRANDVPILLPPDAQPWVQAESRRLIDFAASDDVALHGDPGDLEISERRFGESQWDGHEAEERDAAVAVIVRLTDEIVRLRGELLTANERLGAPPPKPGLGVKLRARGADLGPTDHLRLALRSISRPSKLRRPSWVRRPTWL